MRFLRCGSAMFVAGAGKREVARCGGGHVLWQAQCFVRVGGVDVQIFVLRVVVEVNVAVTLGLACEWVLLGGDGIAKLLGRAA